MATTTGAALALVATLVTPGGPASRPTVPRGATFSRLAGAWTGKGVIDLIDGRSTVIRCHGNYARGIATLDLKVACDYGRYRLALTGNVQAADDGAVTGTFSDSILHVPGKLEGVASDAAISARVSAFGVAGHMDVAVEGRKQSIYIVPETKATGVRAIAIVMLQDPPPKR